MRDCYQLGNNVVKTVLTGSATDRPIQRPYNAAMLDTKRRPGRPRKLPAGHVSGGANGRRLYVKEWMDHLDVTDQILADRVGVARETVYRWHREQHRLTPAKMIQLSKGLGIEPEDLWRRPGRKSLDAAMRDADDKHYAAILELISKIIPSSRN